ncbi:MAG TPA: hypothetical protein DEB39_13770 [Planctomycetaceae bacterium]|nr:hypothetical protein [Planctomycetaceae bacterium]
MFAETVSGRLRSKKADGNPFSSASVFCRVPVPVSGRIAPVSHAVARKHARFWKKPEKSALNRL